MGPQPTQLWVHPACLVHGDEQWAWLLTPSAHPCGEGSRNTPECVGTSFRAALTRADCQLLTRRVPVVEVQPDDLGASHAGAVEDGEDGSVAPCPQAMV